MAGLLSTKPVLSAAIREFAGKAQLPKAIARKAAAVFFKTEEFERRLDGLRAQRSELAGVHSQELESLPSMTLPVLEEMKKGHVRKEDAVAQMNRIIEKMEDSYSSIHKKMNGLLLEEVVTEDKMVEAKAELLLAAPPEFKEEAIGSTKQDDEMLVSDYSKKFEALLDEWRKDFLALEKEYEESRAPLSPEKPVAVGAETPVSAMKIPELPAEKEEKPVELPVEKIDENEPEAKPSMEEKPAELPVEKIEGAEENPDELPVEKIEEPAEEKPAEEKAPEATPAPLEKMPAPGEKPGAVEAPAEKAQMKEYRADVEKAVKRIMQSYSLPDAEHDMLCELFLRLSGEKDAEDSFLRVESLYETASSLLKQMKLDSKENIRAVARNLAQKWESTEGEWRAKSMEMISLLADVDEEGKPLVLNLLKDPGVSASAVLFWFELHYGDMEPRELDGAIMEDKARHPGAGKMIDGFHSIMSGFNPETDRIIAVKTDLPRDRELVLVFEIDKVENEAGGIDYYLLSTPSSAGVEAKFEGEAFERLLATPGIHGIGHSHATKEREEFAASDLHLMIENASIPHLLLNAESGTAQLYNPRIGRIVKIDSIEL